MEEFFTRHVPRAFFGIAFLLLVIGILERIGWALGFSVTQGVFTGFRLLEIAVVLLVFVISLLLRDIRETLKERGP